MARDPTSDSSPLVAFLKQYWKDREEWCVGELPDYLAQFPGDPEAIAREFLALQDQISEGASPTASERSIGPYLTIKELGRGGQGIVYLAEDTRLRRRVALKVLTALNPGSGDVVRRFQREAEVASKLQHPGICSVHDAGVASGIPYIAMQLVPGTTLAQRIARAKTDSQTTLDSAPSHVSFDSSDDSVETNSDEGARDTGASDAETSSSQVNRAEVERIIELFSQLARALHAAHEAGIVHRDIKPGNIMVTPEVKPVILDFGLARDEESDLQTLTRTGDFFGTPAYMSPEQLTAQRIRLDRRTDVYSLGATLYECLTLARPFEAPTREALFNAILTQDPPGIRTHNSGLSSDLDTVVLAALCKDRNRRYQTALDLAKDLCRVRDREPIRARPASAWMKTRLWAARNRALALSLALLAITLVTGTVLSIMFAAQAGRNLSAWRRMSDFSQLRDLESAAEYDLWPAWPERMPEMDAWLERARGLAARLPIHEETLRSLDEQYPDGLADDSLDREDRWFWSVLKELCAGLHRLEDPQVGGIQEVETRLTRARATRERTLVACTKEWASAISAVAADRRFSGFTLRPQIGLVPLGPDPASGLQEFVSIDTGEPPRRRTGTGEYEIRAETGVVLVLLPGGSFRMGAQSEIGGSNYDQHSYPNESPTRRVVLEPFFLSKYEMSQGQWLRLMGTNPSLWNPEGEGSFATYTHPVESVSWPECVQALARCGMVLPTEAQWEYAARAGTDSPFWNGDDLQVVVKTANVLSGGILRHHPIDEHQPNQFGFRGVLGNVYEWCQDVYDRYDESEPRPGDGLRSPEDKFGVRSVRGGCWLMPARGCRSAARHNHVPSVRLPILGVRPARRVL